MDGWEGGGNVVFLIPVCWISGLELVLGIFVWGLRFEVGCWMLDVGCTVYRMWFYIE
jgi:hypothetical protein